jgi:hypothetical protein
VFAPAFDIDPDHLLKKGFSDKARLWVLSHD